MTALPDARECTRARAVVIAGPPASGKTTLGAALARALHYAFIDLDIVTGPVTRAALALAGADETALDGALGARLRDARYGALLDTAAANLAAGLGVVLSGPFTEERSDRARWDAVRERLSATDTALVCLELDERSRHERMVARDAPRDRAKPCRSGGQTADPPPDAIVLDASVGPDALLRATLASLAALADRPADRPADAGNLLRPELEQPSPRSPDAC